jgi:FtsZ-binding cell division protein ZapB
MKKPLLFPVLLLFSLLYLDSKAQIGIGTSTPDKSAVLDVTGTDKGMLVPRMSSAQRKAIVTPAKGLMVFDNDSAYFFFYDGGSWKSLRTVAILSPWHRTGTKVLLNTGTDSVGIGKTPKYGFDVRNVINVDSFYLIGGQRVLNIKGGQNLLIGQNSGKNNTASFNQFTGYQAGLNNTSGDSNYFSGYQAGYSNTSTGYNQFMGYKAGYSNTTGTQDIFIGQNAGYNNTAGSNNQFEGVMAGYLNTTGSINYFSGYHAGYDNTTGSTNMCIGFNAGFSNTSGNGNFFCGTGAGYFNTTASGNFFIGLQTGFTNTTGSQNQFIGHQAGTANTTGSNNQFDGYNAGNKNTTGNYNCFIGYQAGFKNTNGVQNFYSGYNAGYGNVSGSYNCAVGDSAGTVGNGTNNTFLGYKADAFTTGLYNATAIGNGSKVSASNTMAFGNAIVTGWAFGLTTVNSGHALEVGSTSLNGNGAYLTTGGTWTNASDRNKKEHFQDLDGKDVLARISSLPITRWNYKGEPSSVTHIGPVAQDFYRLFHTGNDSISISTIDPAGVALIGVKELKNENDNLKSQLEALQKENEQLKSSLKNQESKIESMSTDIAEVKSLLKSNRQPVENSANVSSKNK